MLFRIENIWRKLIKSLAAEIDILLAEWITGYFVVHLTVPENIAG
jgi:hypothetical protein